MAAGVTWEISRGCRLGLLSTCHCNQESRPENLNKEFLWGGCGDNVQYGYQFSQNFIDIREREKDMAQQNAEYGRALMNRWNNEVGRRVILIETEFFKIFFLKFTETIFGKNNYA